MGWTRHITWGITPGDLLTRVIKHWDDPPSRHITWVTFFRGRTAGQVFPGFPIQNLGFQDLSKGFLKGQFDISKNRGVSSTCSLESQVIKLEAPWTRLIRAPWNNHKLETIHHWHQLQFRPKKRLGRQRASQNLEFNLLHNSNKICRNQLWSKAKWQECKT